MHRVGDGAREEGWAFGTLLCKGGSAKVTDFVSKMIGMKEGKEDRSMRTNRGDVARGSELMGFDTHRAPGGVMGEGVGGARRVRRDEVHEFRVTALERGKRGREYRGERKKGVCGLEHMEDCSTSVNTSTMEMFTEYGSRRWGGRGGGS